MTALRSAFLASMIGIALVVGSGCADSLVAPPELSTEGQKAYEVLREAEVFAGASVGIAGTTPKTVEAFRMLLREPEADEALRALLDRATRPGQLYALAGLYFIDPDYFQRAVKPYLRSDAEVQTFFGCIMDRQRVAKMAERIEDGSLPRAFRGPSELE